MKVYSQSSDIVAKEQLDSQRLKDLEGGNPLAAENRALAEVAAGGGPYEVGESMWWNVEVAHVMRRSAGKTTSTHMHPWLEMTWVIDGAAELHVGGSDTTILVAAGDAWLAPMNQTHRWKNTGEGPVTLFGLFLDAGASNTSRQKLAAALSRAVDRKHYVVRNSSMLQIVRELRREAVARKPGWYGLCQGLLHSLLALLWRELNDNRRLLSITEHAWKRTPDDVAKIRAVHAFIHAHMAEPLTAETIAAKNGVSLRHLNRLCRAHGFASVKQTLQEVRLDQVRQLLRETGYSIREIAALTGFSSADYLSQVFRKEEGVTPTAYRNTVS